MNKVVSFTAGVVFAAGVMVGVGKERLCGAESHRSGSWPDQMRSRDGTVQAVWLPHLAEELVEGASEPTTAGR